MRIARYGLVALVLVLVGSASSVAQAVPVATAVEVDAALKPWESITRATVSWTYDAPIADLIGFELRVPGYPIADRFGLGRPKPSADGSYRAPVQFHIQAGAGYDARICALALSQDKDACSAEVIRFGAAGGGQNPNPFPVTGDESFAWDHGGHPDLSSWQVCVDDACAAAPGGAAARAIPKLPAMTDGTHRIKACAVFAAPAETICGPGFDIVKQAPKPPRLAPTNELIVQ